MKGNKRKQVPKRVYRDIAVQWRHIVENMTDEQKQKFIEDQVNIVKTFK